MPLAVYGQRNRIAAPIDNARRMTLRGHVHAAANSSNDRGAVEGTFALPGITLVLKPSAAQQADMEQLLHDQQDAASADYHRWLTPEQYADRFGAGAADLAQIMAWARSQGLQPAYVARSRTFALFRATAGQAESAFHTAIHRYEVNGQTHFANATEPSIPAALGEVVGDVWGLSDFHPKAQMRLPGLPQMTSSGGSHHMAPDDFATIYDVAPLYTAGLDGTGQSIAIVGQATVTTSDIQAFRQTFNLGAANLQQVAVPGRPTPAPSLGDQEESTLDIEWSGAVARNASIVFVYSDDVWISAAYAVDLDVAPILSMSYGACEQEDQVHLPIYRTLVQQANAEGITWLAASGDSGADACDDQGVAVAQNGLGVNAPASIPEVTGMGGTEFSEGSGTSYWSTSNTANGASALQYIPETGWNDTAQYGILSATGGGASSYFPQPAWQTGAGVPGDGARHVPDLALSSSASHDGYYVYFRRTSGYVGGTSVAAPTMAGIFALLNQYLVSVKAQTQPGLGNVNPTIYRLAQNSPSVFHDVTAGNNIVPCGAGTPNCVNGTLGFTAGPNYDSVTGWGSVDAYNLVHAWSSSGAVRSSVVPSINQNPVFQQAPDAQGNSWRFMLTLTEEAGIGATLTDFTINGTSHASQIASLFGSAAIPARGSLSAAYGMSGLSVPTTVVFGFTGTDAGGTWTSQLVVPFSGPQAQLTVAGAGNAASGQQVYAPGMILSVYGAALGNFAQSAAAIPLPQYLAGFEAAVNGVTAPLYYVSPGQVNLQIPYETQPGPAALTVGNPYVNYNFSFTVAASGPGIFTFADGSVNPSNTASAGQIATLFITGEGQVTPTLATGATPSPRTPLAQLPQPQLAVSLTVGGLPAAIDFIGITSGLVGVTQINFTVPAGIAPGVQPVVVTVGSASSPPATMTITQ